MVVNSIRAETFSAIVLRMLTKRSKKLSFLGGIYASAVAVYFYWGAVYYIYFQSDVLKSKKYENAQMLFEDCVASS